MNIGKWQDFCPIRPEEKQMINYSNTVFLLGWIFLSGKTCSVEFLDVFGYIKVSSERKMRLWGQKLQSIQAGLCFPWSWNCPTLHRSQGAEKTQICTCRFLGETWAYLELKTNGGFVFLMKILSQHLVLTLHGMIRLCTANISSKQNKQKTKKK